MGKRKTPAVRNEEDRFIEGIAAAPEDEALRLVYSDWLEDNGHLARAEYLRAEVKHFVPSKRKKKAELAIGEGVDPVWAAMVSRPPYGILRPRLTFSGGGPPVSRDDIAKLEKYWGVALPADYAAFLLLHNGGCPSIPCVTEVVEPEEAEGELGAMVYHMQFYALGEKDELGRPAHWTSAADMHSGYDHRSDPLGYARRMLIGTMDYGPGPEFAYRLFLTLWEDGSSSYDPLAYGVDKTTLEEADPPCDFWTFTELIERLGDW